ncbi:MAG: HAD family phosphatase [Nitriliruptoraceae bacterium]|nr:HAD family phosphatase [Nitriliruptoraceae bacterium]
MTPQRAVLFDYGGVLTRPLGPAFGGFEADHGIPPGRSFELLVAASYTPGGGLIGAFERGEIETDTFESELRSMLIADGYTPPDDHLIRGMFDRLEDEEGSWQLARDVRAAGARTGLLSNSWGVDIYPWAQVEAHFDVAVVSAQVGLRKPDPAIYHLALERIALPAADCVFIDDLERNVEVARSLGMSAIHHTGDVARTRAAVERFLEAGP